MITKEQALTANEFHYGECKQVTGPRGGKTFKIETWRRNGKTETWKTRPYAFRVPIKYGLRHFGQITQSDAWEWHTAEDCPLRHTMPDDDELYGDQAAQIQKDRADEDHA